MGLYSQAARLAGPRANRAASQLVPCRSNQVYNSGQRALQLLQGYQSCQRTQQPGPVADTGSELHVCNMQHAGFESCTCLQLTAVLAIQVIYVNSADYTAWAYRWQCLESLGNFDDEMVFIKEMASRSPKNYQLWNHRRKFAIKRGASYAQEVTQSSSEQTPG